VIELRLAADTTDATHKEKRRWKTDVAREISLSLAKAIGVDVSALVSVKRTRDLALAVELPAGHDYRGFLGNGSLMWDAPRRTATKKRQRTPNGRTAA
jgi:hypothetical protein